MTGPLRLSMAMLVLVLAPAFGLRMVIAWMYWDAIGGALQGQLGAVDEARTADALVPLDALAVIVAVVLVALATQRWRHACYANALTRPDVGMGWMSQARSAAAYASARRVQVGCYLVLLVAGIVIHGPSHYDRQTLENVRPLFLIQAAAGFFAVLASINLAFVMRRLTRELTESVAYSESVERRRAAQAGDRAAGADTDVVVDGLRSQFGTAADGSEDAAPGRRDRWAAYRGLAWWQTVLALLPLGLVSIGGAIGGAVGGAGAAANLSLARKQFPTALKAVAMIGVVAVAYGAEFAVVEIVRSWAPHHAAAPQAPMSIRPVQPRVNGGSSSAPPPTPSPTPSPTRQWPTILTGVPGVAVTTPSAVAETGVELSWPVYTNTSGDPAKNLVEYQVYRGRSPSFVPSASALISSVPAGTTRFVDSAEHPTPIASADQHGSTWYYMVAVNTSAGLIPGPIRTVRLPAQIAIPATAANTISATQPTSVLNSLQFKDGSRPWVEVGDDMTGPDGAMRDGANRAVFDFGGLSAVPAGSLITEAHLSLWQEGDYDFEVIPYQVHALTRSFVGTQASWNRASSVTAWSRPGADYDPAAGKESMNLSDGASRHDFDATTIVRGWTTSPATDHGLLVKGVDEKTVQLHAFFDGINPTDSSHTPSLVVTYLPRTLDATYDAPETPQTMRSGKADTIPVTITNTTAATWPAGTEALTWHWTSPTATKATAAGATQVALPHDLPPGTAVTVDVPLIAPQITDGSHDEQFTLAWDLYDKATHTYLSAQLGTFDQKVNVEAVQ